MKNLRLNKHTKRGMLSVMYATQNTKSYYRGHNPPEYSKEELWSWLISQVNFDALYLNWINSGYESYLKPSIDRLNDDIGYSFDNIQLITWYENKYKNKIRRDVRTGPKKPWKKSVIAMIGDISNVYDSLNDASRATGVGVKDISMCCREKRLTAGGYKWKFA